MSEPQLTLWKTEGSPPSNAVRTLAGMLGLKLSLIDVDFGNLEHKTPDYLKINPVGTFPVLKDGDFILTDSHAIMKYLLTVYGGARGEALYPSEARARALVDQSMFLDAAVLFIRVKAVLLPAIFEGMASMSPRHIKDIEDGYRMVEAYIGSNQYIAGDHLTIADICVGSTIAATGTLHKLDKTVFSRTAAWLDRLYAVPEFKKNVSNGVHALSTAMETIWKRNLDQQRSTPRKYV